MLMHIGGRGSMAKVNWIWRETAEILGVIGVVSSMIFVAFEIRQNTQVSRAASIQAMADVSIQITLAWVNDDEGLALLDQILDGAVPSELTSMENAKLRMYYVAALRAAESRYRQIDLGLLPEGDTWVGGSAAIYSVPYVAAYWPVLRNSIAADFAAYMAAEYGFDKVE